MSNPPIEKGTKKGSGGSSWPKGRKKSVTSRTGTNGDAKAAIERALTAKDWARARALLHEELVFAPADHWVWMQLSLAYYEDRKYEKVLLCSKRAVELEPRCPLALWHYAGCLYMSGQEDAARNVWTVLLNSDLEEIAYGDCGEGMDHAMRLLNDVHYRLGRYYLWKKEPQLTRTSFEKYLHNRAHGVASSYDEKLVRAELAKLIAASDHKELLRVGKRTTKS
jgi:tetratricopeptide (TPR) repeat protein